MWGGEKERRVPNDQKRDARTVRMEDRGFDFHFGREVGIFGGEGKAGPEESSCSDSIVSSLVDWGTEGGW